MQPDFTKSTIDTVSKRAAFQCSNPECRSQTVGPNTNPQKTTILGEAAHIYGARPKSPRYLDSMSDVARSEITNAIWLCRNCHKKIDRDASLYPAELLFEWRELHEQRVTNELGQPNDLLRLKIKDRELETFGDLPAVVRRIIIDKPDGWEWRLTAELMRHLNTPTLRRMRDLREGLYTRPINVLSDEQLLDWAMSQSSEMAQLLEPLTNLVNRLNTAWGAPGEPGNVEEIVHVCELMRDGLERIVEQEERVHFIKVSEEFENFVFLLKDTLGSQIQKFEEIPKKLDEIVALIGTDHGGTAEQPRTLEYTIVFDLPDGWEGKMKREIKGLENHFVGHSNNTSNWIGCMSFFVAGSVIFMLLA